MVKMKTKNNMLTPVFANVLPTTTKLTLTLIVGILEYTSFATDALTLPKSRCASLTPYRTVPFRITWEFLE